MINKEDNIYSVIELDSFTSAILNALNSQIAILDSEGTIVAFNKNWKDSRLESDQVWTHPNLNVSFLSSLQAPLTEGNDFALRLLLGAKDVLNKERENFETRIALTKKNGQRIWLKACINSLGKKGGAVVIYEDMTHEQQKREHFRETTQKLEKHFHNSLYGILVTNEDHIITEANKVACDLLDTSNDAILHSHINSFLKLDLEEGEVADIISNGGNYLGEKEMLSANGEKIPVELNLSFLRNKDGEKTISWAFRNISARIAARKALKASEQQYKLQFNHTLEGTIIGRPNGLILKANPAACDMLGYSEEELQGRHRDLVFDTSTAVNHKALARRREKGEFTGEVEFTHKEGYQIPVEISSVIYDAEDGTEKTIVSIKDISSRKAMEKQLQDEKEFTESAISSLPTAFFVFNLEGKMIRWNSMLEKDLGYTRDEISGLNVQQLIHPDDRSALSNLLSRKLIGDKVSVEARCITKKGNILHYLLRGTSFKQNGERYIVGGGLNRNNLIEIEQEKQLVTEELKRTQDLNELAVNGANIGLWELELKTGKASYNERWHLMLGYTKEDIEFTRDFFYSIIHPDDRQIPDQEFERYKEAGDRYETEFRLRTKDGSYRWILAIAKFVTWDSNGEPLQMAGSHLDITERKQTEDENKRNQELLNQLFQNSPIGIVQINEEGEVLNINKSFECIFGYQLKEIQNQKLDAVIAPRTMEEAARSLSKFSFTGDSFQTEAIRVRKDGTEIPVVIGGVPVEIDGEIISIYGMYMDITERRKLEDQILDLLETEKQARLHMEDMFEEAPSAIAMLEGPDHTYSFANAQYQKLAGKGNLNGQKVGQILPELVAQGMIELLDQVYKSGKSAQFREKEVYLNHADEPRKFYLDFVYKPLFNEQKEVYGIFVEVIDVTEQVEARQIIENSLAEKETLLNEVHHRVKNNLAIITGLLELETMNISDKMVIKHLHSSLSRITAIAKIHELMYQNENLSHVHFDEYIEDVTKDGRLGVGYKLLKVFSSIRMQEVTLNVNQAIPTAMLLNEIINFMLEHIEDEEQFEPCIEFTLQEENEQIQLTLKDNSTQLLKELIPENTEKDDTHSLRGDLMEALCIQIEAEMNLHSNPEPVLTIKFDKRDIKGPHNSL